MEGGKEEREVIVLLMPLQRAFRRPRGVFFYCCDTRLYIVGETSFIGLCLC
jgi:hypothetical protein